MIFKTLEPVVPGSGIHECSLVSLPFFDVCMFLLCNHSCGHKQVVVELGPIHDIKTAWKHAEGADHVPETNALRKFNNMYFTSLYLMYRSEKNLNSNL